ncbi:MAG: hypothetical protein H3Z52_03625 [archaeon]|nr:hypothetical protein [archaeon]
MLLEILTLLINSPANSYRIARGIKRFQTPAIKRHLELCIDLGLIESFSNRMYRLTPKGYRVCELLKTPRSQVMLENLTKEQLEEFKRSQERPKAWLKLKPLNWYEVHFTSEIRRISTPYGNRDAVDLNLLSASDPEYKPGWYSAYVYQTVLKAKLMKLVPLRGRRVRILNHGKSHGKRWYDYTIELVS